MRISDWSSDVCSSDLSKARPNVTVTRKSPSLAIVDGDAALGPLAARKALDTAIELARETGVAYVGCRNSNHFGGNAPYGPLACRESMILFSGTHDGAPLVPKHRRALCRERGRPFVQISVVVVS